MISKAISPIAGGMAKTASPPFQPRRVFVDRAVETLPYTHEILTRLGKEITIEPVEDVRALKTPTDINWAKKGLLLTAFKPDEPLREFKAMTQSTGRPIYALNLISNCHLECSYCILQSYLANNPLITIYTNLDEVLVKLEDQLDRIPRGAVISTGQIADSLALEPLSHLHARLIPFFARQDRVQLELKTKSAEVAGILRLKHQGQTVVSFSLAPPKIQEEEEFNTATITARLEALVACQKAGYPTGLHFDPIIHHTGWEKNYKALIDQVFSELDAEQVPWVSIGALRFPTRQVRVMRERFPKNRKIYTNLVSSSRRYMHYPDRLREALYGRMREFLKPHLPLEKLYVSMEAEQAPETSPQQKVQ